MHLDSTPMKIHQKTIFKCFEKKFYSKKQRSPRLSIYELLGMVFLSSSYSSRFLRYVFFQMILILFSNGFIWIASTLNMSTIRMLQLLRRHRNQWKSTKAKRMRHRRKNDLLQIWIDWKLIRGDFFTKFHARLHWKIKKNKDINAKKIKFWSLNFLVIWLDFGIDYKYQIGDIFRDM